MKKRIARRRRYIKRVKIRFGKSIKKYYARIVKILF
jgi:hypothetical protein